MVRGLRKPSRGLGLVLRHALAAQIQLPERKLRFAIGKIRGLAAHDCRGIEIRMGRRPNSCISDSQALV